MPAARAGAALAAAGVRPSKARGQNFLVQHAVANRIVDAAELARGDSVIEIGPGLGILSERIAAHPIARLTLVELDSRLAAGLAERFAGDRRVRVVQADFLDVDFAALAGQAPVKAVGNLPFSSAAAILRKLCDNAGLITRMVLMFQREVAERIRARPGASDYSALSVFASLYFEIESHFRVAAGNFHPRPKVDAEVLVFAPRARALFEPSEEGRVLRTVRASFSAPRKTLRNALAHALGLEPSRIDAALARAAIDPGARAEALAAADFVALSRSLGADLNASDRSRDA
ncbi:MAG TPA: 16S rRNA (adenine(1518)-N(6)/adenine(1519)-N(6))-dimethyltransferase RsmA [Candidatus Binataceae bacterium]|nr:16S rRNA (adenine(1518)-N(6)/adenine(1519)-N(6))-dimethyltransferase RsmA [Candidatus Binataceae bacterium]